MNSGRFNKIPEAKVVAKYYFDRISKLNNLDASPRIKVTLANLSKYYLSGKWKDKVDRD